MDKFTILKEYFGHTHYRPGQLEIIDHILAKKDVLGIMPTGAGKSICYQIPAMLLEGMTIVISPLISLMKDQVNALEQAGIRAAYINSSMTPAQNAEVARLALFGEYKILYVAPERLLTDSFLSLCRKIDISMVTVDEAHCISQWGQDFRPSYLRIVEFIERLARRPVVSAFTATATEEVRDDIVVSLRLRNPLRITTGFNRENLHFAVQKPQFKMAALLKIVESHRGKFGIVYCATRKIVEEVCNHLNSHGCRATRYHAGLDEAERHENQDDFLYDRKQVMVATNAFGMGIDKSNVSFVVHYNMPKNVESYYQEAGRAGRDGEPAACILLYSGQDVRLNSFMIEQTSENDPMPEDVREEIRRNDRERLGQMTVYCTTTGCLREFILRYFGEASHPFCGNCSNCLTQFEEAEVAREARAIIACVEELSKRKLRFGKKTIADILHGSKNERIRQYNLAASTAYERLAVTPVQQILQIMDFLIEGKYLALSSDEYPVVLLTPQSGAVVQEGTSLRMKVGKQVPKASRRGSKAGKAAAAAADGPEDTDMFSRLKALRSKLAAAAHVPAYIIFSDATLRDMCRIRPSTLTEMLEVSGVGKIKADKYGKPFMKEIGKV